MNKINLLKNFSGLLIFFISPIFLKVFDMPVWITLIILIMWWILTKLKIRFAGIIFLILILVNLSVNRLLYINTNPLNFSFDIEQSFLGYPGIEKSIFRYNKEGLWLPYSIRNVFYSYYMVIFQWTGGILKLLSPLFWVRILGFSGFSLFLLGIISYFKNKFKEWYVGWWFLIIIISSALRVLGDSVTAVYLAVPAIVFLIMLGTKNKFFEKYYIYWCLLFLVDILLR